MSTSKKKELKLKEGSDYLVRQPGLKLTWWERRDVNSESGQAHGLHLDDRITFVGMRNSGGADGIDVPFFSFKVGTVTYTGMLTPNDWGKVHSDQLLPVDDLFDVWWLNKDTSQILYLGKFIDLEAATDEMRENHSAAFEAKSFYLLTELDIEKPGGGKYELQEDNTCALQPWVQKITMMQQSVLMSAVRGPDGLSKYHPVKYVLRWYRRCILMSAIDKKVITNPYFGGGGSFTGPSYEELLPAMTISDVDNWEEPMKEITDNYMSTIDQMPYHFQMHFMHSCQILGYKHPDERIRNWWAALYVRLVHELHLHPETEEEMDQRLGDTREGWLKRADPATAK